MLVSFGERCPSACRCWTDESCSLFRPIAFPFPLPRLYQNIYGFFLSFTYPHPFPANTDAGASSHISLTFALLSGGPAHRPLALFFRACVSCPASAMKVPGSPRHLSPSFTFAIQASSRLLLSRDPGKKSLFPPLSLLCSSLFLLSSVSVFNFTQRLRSFPALRPPGVHYQLTRS